MMKKTIVMTLLITMIITGLMPVAFGQVNLERISGANRYETSRMVATQVNSQAKEFVLVSGKTFLTPFSVQS